ncbi:DNA-directed RNA polymerase sigma-70 factor [Dyadobacter beijingensis]|uniref:DNA-directed RNA polymerase sigma-70 factor n=1 Tax=Dyadobacter beijingensis TaxID=365489 RepID=A0ABQ2HZB5_9BACT|nr:sigma-70 family RNA polymerase sigma factor [Dyadobacter beijingensis]GGM93753.1 DNA-directed RNA polymerase sigma-70 factor [Dyadobacter beijingensis]
MPITKAAHSPADTAALRPPDACDQAVREAFQAGDRQAFAEIMQTYYPVLLNYGMQFQRDREFVKDCLHDLFIDLWNNRQKLSAVQKLKPYLLSSLRHRLFRETKRLRWFREAEELNDEYHLEVQFAIESYLVSHEVQHEELKRLQANLEKLSKRQREAIYLRFFQEMEYEDIARVMSIHYHSAVNLVYEALRMLRKNWFLSLITAISSIFQA